MKMIKLYLFLFSVFSLSIQSCEKYLNVQSNDKLVVPKSLEDLHGLLDNGGVMNLNLCAKGEKASDNYYIPTVNYNSLSETERLEYIWEDSQYNFPNEWASMYNSVYTSNLVLERLNKLNRYMSNAKDWDQVKGTALFFRATSYLSLVWTYAKAYDASSSQQDLGIILRETSDFNVLSTRSSVEEAYRQIIADLNNALGLLPEESIHALRPNKLAVKGMLARVYLSMRLYDKAFEFADQYLSEKKELLNFNNPAEVNSTANFPFTIFNKETGIYFELKGSIMTNAYANIDSGLYRSYHINDLRRNAYFKSNKNVVNFKGNYSGSSFLFGGIATDEMYLIRAECYARSGRLDKSLDDLNRLLLTRYQSGSFVPFTAGKADEVLNLILEERRKELLFRGLRWIDIKRLNIEGRNIILKRMVDGIVYTLEPNSNLYALPLPADIIRLTGIPQNPR